MQQIGCMILRGGAIRFASNCSGRATAYPYGVWGCAPKWLFAYTG
jgi:hypothetical protein